MCRARHAPLPQPSGRDGTSPPVMIHRSISSSSGELSRPVHADDRLHSRGTQQHCISSAGASARPTCAIWDCSRSTHISPVNHAKLHSPAELALHGRLAAFLLSELPGRGLGWLACLPNRTRSIGSSCGGWKRRFQPAARLLHQRGYVGWCVVGNGVSNGVSPVGARPTRHAVCPSIPG